MDKSEFNIPESRQIEHLQDWLCGKNLLNGEYVAWSHKPRQGESLNWNFDRRRAGLQTVPSRVYMDVTVDKGIMEIRTYVPDRGLVVDRSGSEAESD